MATTKNNGRQGYLVAEQAFDYTDLVTGSAATLKVSLPPNSVITGGFVVVDTAWNSGTSAVLDVGDSGSANRYKNDANLAATGLTALVPTGYKNVDGLDVTLTLTEVGAAATAGAGRIYVEYIVSGRSTEVQRT